MPTEAGHLWKLTIDAQYKIISGSPCTCNVQTRKHKNRHKIYESPPKGSPRNFSRNWSGV